MENKTDILIYQIENGKTKIDVRLEDETVWMTQKSISTFLEICIKNLFHSIREMYLQTFFHTLVMKIQGYFD